MCTYITYLHLGTYVRYVLTYITTTLSLFSSLASSIQLTLEGRVDWNITACPAEHLVLTCSVDQSHHPRDNAAPRRTSLYSNGIVVGSVSSVHLRSTSHLQVEEMFTVKMEKLGMGPSTFVCLYTEDGKNYSSNSLEVNIVKGKFYIICK